MVIHSVIWESEDVRAVAITWVTAVKFTAIHGTLLKASPKLSKGILSTLKRDSKIIPINAGTVVPKLFEICPRRVYKRENARGEPKKNY